MVRPLEEPMRTWSSRRGVGGVGTLASPKRHQPKKSASTSVGARTVERGRVGLHGAVAIKIGFVALVALVALVTLVSFVSFVSLVSLVSFVSIVSLCWLMHKKGGCSGDVSYSRNGPLTRNIIKKSYRVSYHLFS